MPVASTAKGQNVVSLDSSDNIVIEANPLVSGRVHPADVVSAVRRAAFVRDNGDQFVITSVKSKTMLSI